MAKTVALINMKGGVGKSTLAVNLGWELAADKAWYKNVLLIDLDPQFNASQYMLGVNAYRTRVVDAGAPTVWHIFEQHTLTPAGQPSEVNPAEAILNRAVYRPRFNRLDLLASRLELAWSLRQPAQKEGLLARFLRPLADRYELIIIDCAPTESVLTTAAYLTADYVLIPVKPEYLSTIGLPLLQRSLTEFRRQYDSKPIEVLGLVFNQTTGYSPEEMKSRAEVRAVAESLGWYVFSTEISYSRSYPKGAREGRPIWGTSYSRWTQAQQFHTFAEEFAGRINL